MNRSKPRVTTVLLERRSRALKRHLPAAINGDELGVHQARVASRRLREAVPVLSTGLKGSKAGKARRKIRRLTRALGAVRELDVTLLVLNELAARDTLPRIAIEEIRGHVVAERERRRATMLKRLDTVDMPKLEKRIHSVEAALEEADRELWREALISRLVGRAKALDTAIRNAGQMYAPDRLHQVRIVAKKLRYALEIAAETHVRQATGLVRTLKKTQDNLGRLHDLQVLQSHVAEVQGTPATTPVPHAGLDVVARALEDECRLLHAKYIAAVPGLKALTDATRTVVVPLVRRPLQARKRPLKMALGARPRSTRPGLAKAAGLEE